MTGTSGWDRLVGEVGERVVQPELAVIERRVRRRRARRRTAAATGAVVVAVAGGLWAGTPGADGPSGVAASPSGGPVLVWAAAGDADHLYGLLSEPAGSRLVGSDDGGRTWTVRQAAWSGEGGRPRVAAAGTLLAPAVHEKPPVRGRPARLSTDGGRTWADLATATSPVARVPAAGWLACAGELTGQDTCDPWVVDPGARRAGPLATPPDLTVRDVPELPPAAGLWVTGVDGSGRAAVGVSRDGGATWSTHGFPVPEGRSGDLVHLPRVRLSTRDGRTVDAVVGNGLSDYGFRSTDGGRTWHATNGGAPLPGALDVDDPAVTLPDGTHVLQRRDGDRIRPLFGGGAAGYVADGDRQWPATAAHTAPDGTLVSRDWDNLYLSTDGAAWFEVPVTTSAGTG